ncbi:MAG: UDP-N-acetylglucosamine diphosphorylase/glucosamine-1-phosphate N-acetyltransferase [Halothiobacillus sp. 28-55-5]|nr:MAG: UDP-N-acetylglucosamine diphosphorylase/glucosamine-1-phosphate N-acetyltransferase [Halothiobacillus sp. 28-55-5]
MSDKTHLSDSKLHVVILAAGKGTRMHSTLPKVLHSLAGRSMLARVLDAAELLNPASIRVVVGFEAAVIQAACPEPHLHWVMQAQQLGTGHALACAVADLQQAADLPSPDDRVLVLYGDVPLISVSVLAPLILASQESALGVLSTQVENPAGYGRIIRDAAGDMLAIREHRDAAPDELRVHEINTGILVARLGDLSAWLPQLVPHNAQGELYLTDIVGLAHAEHKAITTRIEPDPLLVTGINDRGALADMERAWQLRQAQRLALSGTTIMDPRRLDIRGEVISGVDNLIDVNVVLEGRVTLGNNVIIEPNCVLRNVTLGDGVRVRAFSHLDGAELAAGVEVGPFARLRPGTQLSANSRVGNFVEIKASRIGAGSKINHLSYVGDTTMGADCNIGAGTITCNYDGANKHATDIGDSVFVGSSSQLVAPVQIGDGATIGAGSTITHDVPAGHLAVARVRQTNRAGWQRPKKMVK